MALDILGKNPVQTSLALFVAALGFRLVDLLLLRLDERLGEIIVSKSFGFALVLVYLRLLDPRSALEKSLWSVLAPVIEETRINHLPQRLYICLSGRILCSHPY